LTDSIIPKNFQIQDPYSIFQVLPQQEESSDFDKSMKYMFQGQNSFTQSINRLEAQMSHLVNTMKDRNGKLYLIHYWLFLILLAILIKTKNHGVLETLTKIQFLH